jgi:uncharacterized SAM-binding protein YcdF (DUF218 family)
MFAFKKYLGQLCSPLPLCGELLLLGLLLLWLTRKQRTGKALVTLATLLLLFISTGPGSDWLVAPLEDEYPPVVDPAALQQGESGKLRWVAVLGGGYAEIPDVPANARPSPSTMLRLIEGIRIHKGLPGSKLVLMAEDGDCAKDLRQVAQLLGVDEAGITVLEGGRDTWAETKLLKELLGTDRFVLVTSASHMPRAVQQCRDRGLHPVASPTHYLVRPTDGYHYWLPTYESVQRSERAFYEYLGLAWHRLTK